MESLNLKTKSHLTLPDPCRTLLKDLSTIDRVAINLALNVGMIDLVLMLAG